MEDDIAQQPKLDDLFAELELGLREAYTKITKTIPAEGADEQTLLDSIPAKHPFHEEYKQRLSGITAHNPYHYYFLISDGALLFTPGADNRLSFSAEHQEQLSQLVIDKTTHQKLLRIQQVIRSKPPSTQPKRPSHLNFAALDGGPAEEAQEILVHSAPAPKQKTRRRTTSADHVEQPATRHSKTKQQKTCCLARFLATCRDTLCGERSKIKAETSPHPSKPLRKVTPTSN
jgi:hypothetical protein